MNPMKINGNDNNTIIGKMVIIMNEGDCKHTNENNKHNSGVI